MAVTRSRYTFIQSVTEPLAITNSKGVNRFALMPVARATAAASGTAERNPCSTRLPLACLPLALSSSQGNPAVDVQRHAGDETAFVASKEKRSTRQFFRATQTAEGDSTGNARLKGRPIGGCDTKL
jgi:hypothetical protein